MLCIHYSPGHEFIIFYIRCHPHYLIVQLVVNSKQLLRSLSAIRSCPFVLACLLYPV